MYTYQQYLAAPSTDAYLLASVAEYKTSPAFTRALTAGAYFRGENPEVARKTILRAGKIESRDQDGNIRSRAITRDVVGNRIPSAFFFRFVTQQNQFLLSEGLHTDDAGLQQILGADFDRALAELGEQALIAGTAWGFWNADHLEIIPIAVNPLCGFFPIVDEIDGRIRVGVQFWQLAEDAPLHLRVFRQSGVTYYTKKGDSLHVDRLDAPYRTAVTQDELGAYAEQELTWDTLPLFPLHANPEHRSELTPAIRAKIDAYDRILSDFADNLDRANDVYWVLNNFGGTSEDIAELLEEIARLKAVANISDGSGSASAEPRTIEVPYAARQTALDILQRELYRDYMALNLDDLTGGSLTNVAIRAAMANLHLKSDRYEWQVRAFLRPLLTMLGHPRALIKLRRQAIANESEIVADIQAMRQDISDECALRLNPYIQPEEVEVILAEKRGEKLPF